MAKRKTKKETRVTLTNQASREESKALASRAITIVFAAAAAFVTVWLYGNELTASFIKLIERF